MIVDLSFRKCAKLHSLKLERENRQGEKEVGKEEEVGEEEEEVGEKEVAKEEVGLLLR